MSKIAVVYWSGTGNTEVMADAVADGIKGAGGEAEIIAAASFGPDKMGEFDAFAFGCPSMGSEELEDGEFLPMFESVEPQLAGKKIALFGSYGWGDGEWMRNWNQRCLTGISAAWTTALSSPATSSYATRPPTTTQSKPAKPSERRLSENPRTDTKTVPPSTGGTVFFRFLCFICLFRGLPCISHTRSLCPAPISCRR